jgi:tetraprenyl-beta-curcumene synthase
MSPTTPTPAQLGAFCAVAWRELTWTLPNVRREVARWRRHALTIPDPTLRTDALESLRSERLNLEGAALFTCLPPRRDLRLLRLNVAYQVALDYLDRISDRPAPDPIANGRQLHRALTDALEPSAVPADYYRHHPWHDDGGYLAAIVTDCQRRCRELPAYDRVKPHVLTAARRIDVQILNHDPDPARRDASLAAFAAQTYPDLHEPRWFELTAAASSTVGVHALLALAADPTTTEADVLATDAAYAFSICAASTLLDSLVDEREDADAGNHSYVAHYADAREAIERICTIVAQARDEAAALRRGNRHALIAGGIVAMYLSKDDAYRTELRPTVRRILRAAGPLPTLQRPIMRTLRRWRGLQAA